MHLTNIASSADLVQAHPEDNVAIAREPFGGIPAGHKVAIRAISPGAPVLRYGEIIGYARGEIRQGEHVHTHNVESRTSAPEYEFPTSEAAPARSSPAGPVFLGYPRTDGRAGTRNYIAVAAASNCSAHVAESIALHFRGAALPPGVDGVAAFPHGDGCGHAIGPDTDQLYRTMRGVIDHPNVCGGVIVGLGCEVNQIERYLGEGDGERLTGLAIQDSGGTAAAVQAGIEAVRRHIEFGAALVRREVPAAGIVLGLNCGGSDSFSGVTANPALGFCSDLLVAAGATAVLAETPEIFGAEHLLVRRARNRAVAEALLERIEAYRAYLGMRATFDDNPAPGNKEGGLTNIVEKSLGAVAKAGSSPLMSVVDFADRIPPSGLVFMNTPGFDPVSLTGLAAGGANVIAFTTGRGTGIGFPTVPVIKIATNSRIFRRMRDNLDINAGTILDGAGTIERVGCEILDFVLRVASGERTASERLGHREFVPWRIGPVL